MSRSFARLFCVVAVLATAPLAVGAAAYTQGGYAERTSVAQGETIAFHIATSVSPFALEVVNLAQPTQVLKTIAGLSSATNDCTGKWETGCDWPLTTQFTVPMDWPSGYYAARFPTSGGTRQSIFVVRAANPGLTSPIVVVSASNTAQAYNQFGGKSVYDSISTNNKRAHIVSFDRPYFDNLGLGRYPAWEQQFVDFMTAENRPFEVITDDDLTDPTILGHYRLVLLVGHSEYWTLPARQNLEAFVNGGGNVAVFGGNTMWWQARVNAAPHTLTVYKDASLDPMNGVQNDVVTVNWYDRPVYHPENSILGLSFRHGGYANVSPGTFTALPIAERTPYTVVDASNWVFSGTGLLNGQTFGKASAGTEVDGVVFNTRPDGTLFVDGSDGSPLTFQILATVPGEEGYGTIGYYTNANGGAVFNVGTRDWTIGLSTGDAAVQQITRNVMNRLSLTEPLPHEERTTLWRAEELFNTPSPMEEVLPNWSGEMLQAELSPSCATEGPTGLQLKGTDWTQLIRSFSPDHTGIATATLQFQMNLDALTATPTFAMPIVELIDKDPSLAVYAAVELHNFPARSIRLRLYRADGSAIGGTAYAVVPAGWQPVTLTWRSPGMCVLDVGSSVHLEINNTESGQRPTELMIEYAGSGFGATGFVCLDALQLRDTLGPVPTVLPPPSSVDATTVSTIEVMVTWTAVSGAASYRVERSANDAPFAEIATVSELSFEDFGVSANTSYLYRVIALDSFGTVGTPGAPDVATTKQFTSDPNRIIRAAHINDLRAGIDLLRASAGLSAASYSRSITAGKIVKASDLTQMRSAVDAARSAAGLPAFPYAETIAPGAIIKWSHWRELQMAIGAIPAAP